MAQRITYSFALRFLLLAKWLCKQWLILSSITLTELYGSFCAVGHIA